MKTSGILNELDKVEKNFKNYIPDDISVYPIVMLFSRNKYLKNMLRQHDTYGMLSIAFDRYRLNFLSSKSNNWLKMHGYHMRRKL